MVLRLAEVDAVAGRDLRDRPGREFGMGVDPGSGGGSPQRHLGHFLAGSLHPRHPQSRLARVAAELLSEADRRRVHEVRAARLDDPVEVARLLGEGVVQAAEGGDQLAVERGPARDVDRGRDDVVRGLAVVDVVVRMDMCRVRCPAVCQRRDHLVRVHVGGRARSGLVDVQGEVVVPPAFGDFPRSGGDGRAPFGREESQLDVGLGGGLFQPPERLDEAPPEAPPADGKVLDRALGLRAVKGVGGNPHLAHGVLLDSMCFGHDVTPRSLD